MAVKELEYYAITNWPLLLNNIQKKLIEEWHKPNLVDIWKLGLKYSHIRLINWKGKIDNVTLMQIVRLDVDVSECVGSDTL